MPVVFLCQNCRSRLKVTRRKIGTQVECPRCRVPVTVPAADAASAAVSMAEGERPASSGDLFPEFAVFDEQLPAPAPSSLPPPPPAASKSRRDRARDTPSRSNGDSSHELLADTPPAPSKQHGPRALPPAPVDPPVAPSKKPTARPSAASPHALGVLKRDDQPSSYSEVLLIRRRTLYLQAALICLMAVVGLLGGYFIGRSIGPVQTAPPTADSSVQIVGTLSYHNARGEETPDSGAVVIALPVDLPVNRQGNLASAGLGPHTPREAGHVAEMAIEELGGKYDRTDGLGNFVLKLPKPGRYHLLFISRGAERQGGQPVPAAQLKEMQRFFTAPSDLIGSNRYTWAQREIREPRLAVLHTF
jgi:hypothetical protein